MKRISTYFLAILFAGFFTACNNDDEDEVLPFTQQDAISKAMEMTSGTLVSSRTKTDGAGESYYAVTIETTTGGIVEFGFYEETGDLKRIEAEQGPYDYEVNPGMGLIKFSKAKEAALNKQQGEVLNWSLEEDFPDVWIYIVDILDDNDDDFTVEVNAQTGAVK